MVQDSSYCASGACALQCISNTTCTVRPGHVVGQNPNELHQSCIEAAGLPVSWLRLLCKQLARVVWVGSQGCEVLQRASCPLHSRMAGTLEGVEQT